MYGNVKVEGSSSSPLTETHYLSLVVFRSPGVASKGVPLTLGERTLDYGRE